MHFFALSKVVVSGMNVVGFFLAGSGRIGKLSIVTVRLHFDGCHHYG